VVELTPEANTVVSPLIPNNLAGEVFTSFGVPLVDAALAFVPVQSITRLYGEVEPFDVDPRPLAERTRWRSMNS
jgi:hypothetical protein